MQRGPGKRRSTASLGVAAAAFGALFWASVDAWATGPSLLSSLSGTWNDLESFVTLGQCASAPLHDDIYRCNPAYLATVSEHRFDAIAFLSGTDSDLGLANALSSGTIDSTTLNDLFGKYNYSEAVLNTQMAYATRYWMLGISPARVQGQFQVHNPALPLGSFSLREEVNVFAGGGWGRDFGPFSASIGAKLTFVGRDETLGEDTIVDFSTLPTSALLQHQRMYGLFSDVGAALRYKNAAAVSVLFQDIGGWLVGTDTTPNYLFIYQDRNPRGTLSISWTPRIWAGNLQAGVAEIAFLTLSNSWSDQWLATLGYYVGPLRVVSAFRAGLFRTGLTLRFTDFEVSVAQEWINQIEAGRENQPRFIVGGALGL